MCFFFFSWFGWCAPFLDNGNSRWYMELEGTDSEETELCVKEMYAAVR